MILIYSSFCSFINIVKAFPMMTHLLRPNENTQMTYRRIISLLKPNFAKDGSNERLYQNKVYNIYKKLVVSILLLFLLLVS